jgi:hypothetical protein
MAMGAGASEGSGNTGTFSSTGVGTEVTALAFFPFFLDVTWLGTAVISSLNLVSSAFARRGSDFATSTTGSSVVEVETNASAMIVAVQ